ncbi:unnamed protein product [Macrosiphum euphorbiae]|nr:unnamed protein product [Macrosiphum euphorbiae]
MVSLSSSSFADNMTELGALLNAISCSDGSSIGTKVIKGVEFFSSLGNIFIPDSITKHLQFEPECKNYSAAVNDAKLLYEDLIIIKSADIFSNYYAMLDFYYLAANITEYLIDKPRGDENEALSYKPILPTIRGSCDLQIKPLDVRIKEYYTGINGMKSRSKRGFWGTTLSLFSKTVVKAITNSVKRKYHTLYSIKKNPKLIFNHINGLSVAKALAYEAAFVSVNSASRYYLKKEQCLPPALRSEYCTNLENRSNMHSKVLDAYSHCVNLLSNYNTDPVDPQ